MNPRNQTPVCELHPIGESPHWIVNPAEVVHVEQMIYGNPRPDLPPLVASRLCAGREGYLDN